MGDLISRQAAIDAVAKNMKGLFIEYEDVAEKIINKVPSAQQNPVKHGKWIPHEETTEFSPGVKLTAKGYICSECGERFGCAWTWCGNCGAKMDKGEDE